MQRVQEEFKEFFKPTARCFKGFTILLAIWGLASLAICGLVPTIIKVHNPLPNSQKNSEFGGGSGGDVHIDPLLVMSKIN